MTTAAEEMRETLTDLKIPAKKADAIMERFTELLADQQQCNGTVWVSGSRPAVETVEVYGLEIGIDACGNAEWVTAAGVGIVGLDVEQVLYDGDAA
jgi:hypothetical protein